MKILFSVSGCFGLCAAAFPQVQANGSAEALIYFSGPTIPPFIFSVPSESTSDHHLGNADGRGFIGLLPILGGVEASAVGEALPSTATSRDEAKASALVTVTSTASTVETFEFTIELTADASAPGGDGYSSHDMADASARDSLGDLKMDFHSNAASGGKTKTDSSSRLEDVSITLNPGQTDYITLSTANRATVTAGDSPAFLSTPGPAAATAFLFPAARRIRRRIRR